MILRQKVVGSRQKILKRKWLKLTVSCATFPINSTFVCYRNQLNGIYDTLKNVVTEAGETEADYFGPSSTYAMAERSGIIRGGATRGGSGFFISSNNRNTTTSTVFPAPAEALLGISPTTASACTKVGGSLQLLESESESCTNWAQTFKKHLAQRRALPTTIESFDDEEDSEVTTIFMQQ